MHRERHKDLALDYVEVIPSGKQGPLPLIVVLHGRGADSEDLADLAPHVDCPAGARFVFPDAPNPFQVWGTYTRGYSWFDGWPATPASFRSSREVLMKFLDEVQQRYDVSDGRTVLAGFSQGGLMSLDAGFRRKEPLAGIVVMSGGINENDLPDLKRRPEQKVLIVHGVGDDVIPVVFARKTRRILEEHGVQPDYREFDMGHWVSDESVYAVRDFICGVLA